MNDPIEHATGIEKYELLAKQAGNDVSKKAFNQHEPSASFLSTAMVMTVGAL